MQRCIKRLTVFDLLPPHLGMNALDGEVVMPCSPMRETRVSHAGISVSNKGKCMVKGEHKLLQDFFVNTK